MNIPIKALLSLTQLELEFKLVSNVGFRYIRPMVQHTHLILVIKYEDLGVGNNHLTDQTLSVTLQKVREHDLISGQIST